MWKYYMKTFSEDTLGKLSTRSEWIHSDEGLKLETSVLEYFMVADLPYRPCG